MRKKVLSLVFSLILVFGCVSLVSAHDEDYFLYGYSSSSGITVSNLKLRIASSAQNTIQTSTVYNSATSWNGISSNVAVSVTVASNNTVVSNYVMVSGQSYSDNTLGETIPYDSSGNITGANTVWSNVEIIMNTNMSTWGSCTNPPAAAKKSFLHEVGHVLKLAHPVRNSYYSGHTYASGYPLAIMNQGFPNGSYIPTSIQTHDKTNLKAKWGS